MAKLKIYVLGNPLLKEDDAALRIAKELKAELKDVEFVEFDPVEKISEKKPVFLDVSPDVKDVFIIEGDVNKLKAPPMLSMHDYDLSVMLNLFIDVGLIRGFTLILIPSKKEVFSKQEIRKVKSIIESMLK